ncbi:hypothetical protein [Nitrosomonas sp. Nm166]|uniref:hypothetical protein n=1 Tax=Nitrosomonas sp. Nm166 TaxID=1881054 RepID=UPI0035254956
MIVGADFADPNGERSGSSYVVFGRSSFTDGGVIRGTPGDDTLTAHQKRNASRRVTAMIE